LSTIRQILVDWTTVNGSGKVSVLYFEATPTVVSQRIAIGALFLAANPFISTSTTWSVRTTGVELESVTGALVGSWTDSNSRNGAGTGSGQNVADSTQMLLRWKTPTIVNGRFLQGRTFVPGLVTGQLSGGNLISSTVTTMNTAATAFIASPTGFGVWNRPLKDPTTHVVTRPGTFVVATAGTTWSELAVLRRRRG